MARELGVDDAANFAGFVDAREALGSHDVLVQPSRADNLSYTLLDAVNSGLGVVASDIGGNPEILPPRCLAPLSDESAMADAVIEQGLDVSKRPH
ncbi:glycosyltransferase, partial [Corallococcus sp. AB050B]